MSLIVVDGRKQNKSFLVCPDPPCCFVMWILTKQNPKFSCVAAGSTTVDHTDAAAAAAAAAAGSTTVDHTDGRRHLPPKPIVESSLSSMAWFHSSTTHTVDWLNQTLRLALLPTAADC